MSTRLRPSDILSQYIFARQHWAEKERKEAVWVGPSSHKHTGEQFNKVQMKQHLQHGCFQAKKSVVTQGHLAYVEGNIAPRAIEALCTPIVVESTRKNASATQLPPKRGKPVVFVPSMFYAKLA